MRQVSVDIGGTFTDCFLVYDHAYVEAKSLTTHHNLASGFMDAQRFVGDFEAALRRMWTLER